jgi:sugar phosphate isomerase/epimerase
MTTAPAWVLSGFGDEIDADPEVQIAVLQALGAGAIEVRSAWDVNVIDLGPDRLHQLSLLLKRRGQSVSAIASPIGKVDVDGPVGLEVDRLDRAIEAAHLLGTRFIRVFSFYRPADRSPESVRDAVLTRMRALADRARRDDVILLHENEKEIYGDIPERILDLVESVGSEHLRLAWDSANFVQCGVRPHTDGWSLLHRYVDYVQVKDALAASGREVPAGQGDGELPATLTALRDNQYSGYLSLEPHLGEAGRFGGFSGPAEFGRAARALASLVHQIGGSLV